MSDAATEFRQRAERRLREEQIIWLVTVDGNNVPQPSPVWFWWDGTAILIYSRENTPKLRNIARNPAVALHLDGDEHGGDIIVLIGSAEQIADPPRADTLPEYIEKYRDGIARIGMTPESFATTYRAALRVTVGKMRGH